MTMYYHNTLVYLKFVEGSVGLVVLLLSVPIEFLHLFLLFCYLYLVMQLLFLFFL
jgi:hypothetical protein